MAETTITPTQLTKVGSDGVVITPGAGTAINTANTMIVAYPNNTKLLLTIDSNHADTVATIGASDYAIEAGKGALTYAVGDTVEHLIVVPDQAQVRNKDGNIDITWAANSAGFVTAWYLPL